MKRITIVAMLLAGFCFALSAAESPVDDNPVIFRYEVGNVDMTRIPPAPRHLNAMLALLRDGSVMVMLYQRHDFSALTLNELYDVQLCLAAQKARAQNLADRLWIITGHRVQFTPRDPKQLLSIAEKHATVSSLSELLEAYGELKVE
jgi:hypothetical protein